MFSLHSQAAEEEEAAAVTLGFSDTDTETSNESETMDVDDEPLALGKSFSLPCFMRKVFKEEASNAGDDDHKLLIMSVHSVLLEFGFVCFDSLSGIKIDGFRLPYGWASTAFTTSLSYTLPDLLGRKCHDSNAIATVVLKFQSLGRFFNIYGSLTGNGSDVYRVCLDSYRFVPPIYFTWTSSDLTDEKSEKDGYVNSYPENEVYEFRKIVKDGLALPLAIDLCEKMDLMLPPCLMRLPWDLTFKILELLPGVDIAKVGCVCSGLQSLSSNNDLWKRKFTEEFGNEAEEFGNEAGAPQGSNWKEWFALYWDSRNMRKSSGCKWRKRPWADVSYCCLHENRIWHPANIGGDYNRLPGHAVPSLSGQRSRAITQFLQDFVNSKV